MLLALRDACPAAVPVCSHGRGEPEGAGLRRRRHHRHRPAERSARLALAVLADGRELPVRRWVYLCFQELGQNSALLSGKL